MLYCNLPHLQAKQGERVRLYLMSLGTEDGIHGPGIAASNLDWDVRPWRLLAARGRVCRPDKTYVAHCYRHSWLHAHHWRSAKKHVSEP